MPVQTVTRAVESGCEPQRIYAILADVRNIPLWAPVFADQVERTSPTHCRVTKNGESFNVQVVLHPDAGTVDLLREMAQGRRGGACIRVTPRPLGGSTVTMTVPIAGNTSESEVAKVLEQELATLVRLAES